MAITIKSTADVGANGIKMMLYGKWGAGKTPMLATAPNPIIISAEQGLLSIRKIRPPLPLVEIKNFNDLVEVYNWLAGSNEAKQFYTICLDSLNELIEVLLVEERKKAKDGRQAFYAVGDTGISWVRALRDLPGRSVVVVAKEEFSQDATGNRMYMPMMPGNKLNINLPHFFDEVLRLVSTTDPANPTNPQRYVCTQTTFQWQARDRSGNLAEYEPPNLEHIFRKILAI